MMFGSAPWARSSISAVKCPCWAAKCNGVSFSAVRPLGSAGSVGCVSNNLQISACPAQAARCNGDEPLVSNKIGFMSSCESKSWTTSLEEDFWDLDQLNVSNVVGVERRWKWLCKDETQRWKAREGKKLSKSEFVLRVSIQRCMMQSVVARVVLSVDSDTPT